MTTTIDTNMQALADGAVRIARDAAAEYLARHNQPYNVQRLTDAFMLHVKPAIMPALDDFAEAYACGMRQIADVTFAASMRLAGIAAAKSISPAR